MLKKWRGSGGRSGGGVRGVRWGRSVLVGNECLREVSEVEAGNPERLEKCRDENPEGEERNGDNTSQEPGRERTPI